MPHQESPSDGVLYLQVAVSVSMQSTDMHSLRVKQLKSPGHKKNAAYSSWAAQM